MKGLLHKISTLVMDAKLVEGKQIFTLSLGRVSFLLVLGLSIIFWAQGGDIPENLKQVLMALAGYNFATKGIQAFNARGGA